MANVWRSHGKCFCAQFKQQSNKMQNAYRVGEKVRERKKSKVFGSMQNEELIGQHNLCVYFSEWIIRSIVEMPIKFNEFFGTI